MKEENKFKKNPAVTGVGKIAVERQRQVIEKGYTTEHDAKHSLSDLIKAAGAYRSFAAHANTNKNYPDTYPMLRDLALAGWPWSEDSFKPVDVETALTKAGAMIAAALDRLEAAKEN
jgi:hypothetical protein